VVIFCQCVMNILNSHKESFAVDETIITTALKNG
jgi:hypothetical protein